MKFKFDKRIGQMIAEERKQIYFARSMSGGLRIDDKIHNITYVVERNEEIKIISGRRDIKIYNLLEARNISNRVCRMFGSKHKYSDYKHFLKY